MDIPGTTVSGNPESNTFFNQMFSSAVTASKVRFQSTDNFVRAREVMIFAANEDYPEVALASPANGSTFSEGEGIFLQAGAMATAPGAQIDSIAFFTNGARIGSDPTPGDGFSLEWDAVSGQHFLTAVAYDNLGHSIVSRAVSVTVYPLSGNIALLKPASADSQFDSRFPPELAVDGSLDDDSRWMSVTTGPEHWLEVDLLGEYRTDSTKLFFGFGGDKAPSNFVFQYWNDSTSAWADYPETSVSGNPATTTDFSFQFSNPVTTSKVRIHTTDSFIRMRELQLFGEKAIPDTLPPTTPANLAVSNTGENSFTLSWAASTDNVGVTGYDVLLDGAVVDTTAGLSYAYTGLSVGTAYTPGVRARDTAGNLSATATISASTNCQRPNGHATASGITATGATVSWDSIAPGSYKLRYRVYYAPTPWVHPWQYVESIYAASQSISGLDSETEYQWSVAYLCGTSETYSWNKTFTTLPPPQARPGGIPGNIQVAAGMDQSFAIAVFPNPAHGQFNLKIESNHADERAWLQVLDAGGKVVLSQPVAIQEGEQILEILLDRNLFQPGLYFVQAAGRWGRECKKLIIE